jgi:hypothetical protein
MWSNENNVTCLYIWLYKSLYIKGFPPENYTSFIHLYQLKLIGKSFVPENCGGGLEISI